MDFFKNYKCTFRILIVVIIFLFGKDGLGQASINGKISDKETGEDMMVANIIISQKGVFKKGTTTDVDGNYSIQVDSGKYDMEVSYTGYPTQKITGIIVNEDQATKVDVLLSTSYKMEFLNVVVMGMTIRLITPWDMLRGIKINKNQIQHLPTRDINDLILMAPGVIRDQ